MDEVIVVTRLRMLWLIIGQAKRAPYWGVQSRYRVIYDIYICVFRGPKSVGGITCANAQSQYWAVESDR